MKKKMFIVTTVPDTFFFFRGQIEILKKLFVVSFVSNPGQILDDKAALEKVSSYEVEMKREISLVGDIKSLYQFIVLFLKTKPYIVHGNTPKGALLSMIAAFFCKVPKRIYCIHGLRYQGDLGIKRKILKIMERLTCFFATDILAVSHGIVTTLKKDKITSKDIIVIGNGSINGIDSEYFNPSLLNVNVLRKDLEFKEGNLVFGFVGRLVKDKGINELIEAFVSLNKEYPHIRLLLVGFMEELDPLLESTKKQILSHDHIKFVGLQMDIRPYLKLMDIFTFPSYREGFGVCIMEAAVMGVPVISSDIIGCNEIIKDGFNGKLIHSKSSEELRQAMEIFINNPKYRNELASNCRTDIIERYDQQLIWKAIYDFYEKLL